MFGISSFAQTPFASLAGTAFLATMDENIGLDDSSSQIYAYSQSVTESINAISDVINDAGVNYFGSATERITSDDSSSQLSTYLQSIAEDFSPADLLAISAQFAINTAEDFGADDSSVQYFAAQEDRTESIDSILDAYSVTAQFQSSATENVNIDDTPTINAQFLNDITEPFTVEDVNDGSAGFVGVITEDMTMEDFETIANAFFLDITENSSFDDSYVASYGGTAFVSEGISVLETELIGAQFAATINEIIVLASYAIEKGWFKINDNQTANWSAINDGQSPGWGEITFTQSANWTKINNGQ